MSLRIEALTAGYGPVTVLRDVDLLVPAGAAVALLGSNGAGKTSLLRAVSGVLPLTRGRVLLDGVDLRGASSFRRNRAGLCLVPEGRGIFPALNVRENISMFASGQGVREAVQTATDAFPVLGQRLTQLAGTLSGGEQQMLALSRAILTRPRVVLADELSLGLAPVIVDQIFDALTALRAEGVSLLIVEQYVDRVLDLVDWVFLLHKGSVVWAGDPETAHRTRVYESYLHGAA